MVMARSLQKIGVAGLRIESVVSDIKAHQPLCNSGLLTFQIGTGFLAEGLVPSHQVTFVGIALRILITTPIGGPSSHPH